MEEVAVQIMSAATLCAPSTSKLSVRLLSNHVIIGSRRSAKSALLFEPDGKSVGRHVLLCEFSTSLGVSINGLRREDIVFCAVALVSVDLGLGSLCFTESDLWLLKASFLSSISQCLSDKVLKPGLDLLTKCLVLVDGTTSWRQLGEFTVKNVVVRRCAVA